MRGSLLALALLGAPAALQGQDPRLEGRLDPATRAAVGALVDSARAAGLPTEPLVDKALEGATKHASGDRILAVLRTLSIDLRTARGALGPDASDADVAAGATAIRAGAQADLLGHLEKARGKSGLAMPLAVLSDLVARGVPVDTAASVVLSLAQRGASDADFTGLERGVAQDIGAGAPPGVAAAVRAHGGTAGGEGRGGGPPAGVPASPPRKGTDKPRPPGRP
ncbi:MAG: hypothetical protein ACM3NS_04235 [Deltaproteobacteria bacterium]